MSIIVSGVTKLYGEQKALEDVSFAVSPGQIVGFLGPNGAGKSTMMRIITGYVLQNSGEVEVRGVNTKDSRKDFRKFIGYLPESNPLYPDMYVKEYLQYVAGIYKLGNKRQQRINEVIDQTGIGEEQGKKIGSLSKGYRQRVGLAQALVHNPSVLILDEPTSGLDPNQIIDIRRLIASIGRDKTVLLSTHIMQEVEAICNHIVIISKGKVVANGSATEVLSLADRTDNSVKIELLEKVEESLLLAIPGVGRIAQEANNSWVVFSEDDSDIRAEVFNFIKENGLTLISMQQTKAQLGEVFQQLTASADR